MERITKTISVRDFMAKYAENPAVFDQVPEFGFLKPVAAKAISKGCTCGMGQEIARATAVFNDLAADLSPDTALRVKQVFGVQSELCFGIISANGEFAVKCYA